jgi:RHS repeat-associated protein
MKSRSRFTFWMSGTGDVTYSKSVQSVQSAVISSLSRFTYSYLANSNLPASVTGLAHTVTNTWAADRDALLSKENKTGATTVSSYTYTVNALGQRTNLATDGTAFASSHTTDWGYDALGQVTSAAKYSYDSFGRRIAKTSTINNQQSTIYLYDGWNVIAEYVGSAGLQPALSQTYLWGTDLSGSLQGAGGVGGLLAVQIQNPQSSIFYPSYDGNGNVSEYLGQDGTVAAHFEYDPFGNTTVNTDTAGLFNYRFSTKPLDAETGLYYYGYRYYDPATGRWPSRDTIGEKGGVNLYGFIGNDSLNKIDLLGEKSKADCWDEKTTCDLGCKGLSPVITTLCLSVCVEIYSGYITTANEAVVCYCVVGAGVAIIVATATTGPAGGAIVACAIAGS